MKAHIIIFIVVLYCLQSVGAAVAGPPLPQSKPPKPEQMLDHRLGGPPPHSKPLGSLFLGIANTTLTEGENTDVVVLLQSGLSFDVPSVISLDTISSSGTTRLVGGRVPGMSLRVQRLKPGKPITSNDLISKAPGGGVVADWHPHGGAFTLKAGGTHGRVLTLSELLGGLYAGGRGWLKPGRYLVQAIYSSTPPSNLAFANEDEIDWKTPLISGGLVLTITAPPNDLAKVTAEVRQFVLKPNDHTDGQREAMTAAYRHLMSEKLPPYLKKRVFWRYAHVQYANGHSKVALEAANKMATMQLTPAENQAVQTFRGERLFKLHKLEEAKKAFAQGDSPRAKFMLDIIQKQLEQQTSHK